MSKPMTELQTAILFVLDQTYLCKQYDGTWWPAGSASDSIRFSQADVRHLVACDFAQMLPIGAIITSEGRAELRRRHLLPADTREA